MQLLQLVQTWARDQSERIALLAPDQSPVTFAQLGGRVQALGDALARAGVTAQTPVAMAMPNGLEAAVCFLGVASHAPCVPLNPALSGEELRFCIEDAGARFIVSSAGVHGAAQDAARRLALTVVDCAGMALQDGPVVSSGKAAGLAGSPACAPEDVALMLHTSGTTSRPKLVPLTHANLVASARSVAQCLALGPSDRSLNVMPLFHIHGLVGVLLASLVSGSSVVCTPGYKQSAFVDWVEAFQPTWYSAVPTIHQSVLAIAQAYRKRLPQHRFRFIRSSSAALSPTTARALEAAIGAPVVEAYGMTEASHQMASNPLPPALRKGGSVGLPAGAQIQILGANGDKLQADEIGEIVVRGPGVMTAYGGMSPPAASAFVDGWFRTGDLGRIDSDGYVFITGRLKEIVNRGGEKVSPREVDDALLEHHQVLQAATFGVPHPTLGEDLVAAVVAKPNSGLVESTLRHFLIARMAAHKVPSRLLFVDELPKGSTGKVQRHKLHEQLGALLQTRFVEATGDIERSVQAIFRSVLQLDAVGAHDNFFALGGDSLKGMRAVSQINREHGVNLAATALFHHPTVVELAVAIDQAAADMRTQEAELMRDIESMTDEEVEQALAAEEAALRGRPEPMGGNESGQL
jgi:acyl-CoA synthetase (AMP-forming)/AMP-acid ligase II